MCGRFYVDEEVWREIYRIAEASGRGQSLQKHAGLGTGGRRDVFPSSQAMVIRGVQKRAEVQNMKWGYEIPGLKKLLINARSETVREKRLFGQDFACRRCLIPAKGFYEWKRSGSGSGKTKYRFHDGSGILYLAGIYRISEQGEEFTILTRAAEGCMEGIHSRMPLLIDAGSRWGCFRPVLSMNVWLLLNRNTILCGACRTYSALCAVCFFSSSLRIFSVGVLILPTGVS